MRERDIRVREGENSLRRELERHRHTLDLAYPGDHPLQDRALQVIAEIDKVLEGPEVEELQRALELVRTFIQEAAEHSSPPVPPEVAERRVRNEYRLSELIDKVHSGKALREDEMRDHPLMRACVSRKNFWNPADLKQVFTKKKRRLKKLDKLAKTMTGGVTDIPKIEQLLSYMRRNGFLFNNEICRDLFKRILAQWMKRKNFYALAVYAGLGSENRKRDRRNAGLDEDQKLPVSAHHKLRTQFIANVMYTLFEDGEMRRAFVEHLLENHDPTAILPHVSAWGEAADRGETTELFEILAQPSDPQRYTMATILYSRAALSDVMENILEYVGGEYHIHWVSMISSAWFLRLLTEYGQKGDDWNQVIVRLHDLYDFYNTFEVGGRAIQPGAVAKLGLEHLTGKKIDVSAFQGGYYLGVRERRILSEAEEAKSFIDECREWIHELPTKCRNKSQRLQGERRTTVAKNASDWVDIKVPVLNHCGINRIYYFHEDLDQARQIGVVIESHHLGAVHRYESQIFYEESEGRWKLAFPEGTLLNARIGASHTHQLMEFVIIDAVVGILCKEVPHSDSKGTNGPRKGKTDRQQLADVRGHTKRLPGGQKPRSTAAQEAAAYGITLPDGYTFVNPHTRTLTGEVKPVSGTLATHVEAASKRQPHSVYSMERLIQAAQT